MSGRLDDEKLETLRRWGAGLGADERDELRAAGKAILILVDEIERLQVDVWHARRSAPRADTTSADAPSLESLAEEFLTPNDGPPGLEPTLRGRVGRLLRARSAEKQ